MNPFSQIFKYFTVSMIFGLIGLIIGNMFISTSVVYMANKVVSIMMILILILALCSRKGMIPRRFSMNFVYLFTFIQGVLLYPTINYYLYDLGVGMVLSILISTILIFGALSIYAKNNETSSVLNYGKILIFILLGVIIGTVVNIFLGSSLLSILVSILGVLVFSIYIIYDINLIKRDIQHSIISDKNDLSYHVLNLYIDFINLLLDLLNLASRLKNN